MISKKKKYALKALIEIANKEENIPQSPCNFCQSKYFVKSVRKNEYPRLSNGKILKSSGELGYLNARR